MAAAPKAEALVAVAAKATVAGGQAELAILLVVGVAMLLLVVADLLVLVERLAAVVLAVR